MRAHPTIPIIVAGCALVAGLVRAQSGPGSARPAASLAPSGDLTITVESDRVTVTARGVPRRALLEAVAARAGLALELDGRLDEPITLAFADLPLRDALRRILRGHAFVARYAEAEPGRVGGAGRLWVFSTAGATSRPAESTRDGPRAEHDLDAAARAEAVFALGERADRASLELLERALIDPDRRVRRAAIDALGERGAGGGTGQGEAAAWALDAALRDPVDDLRELAVDALADLAGGDGDAAGVLLRRALADERAAVRQAAAEALELLDSDG